MLRCWEAEPVTIATSQKDSVEERREGAMLVTLRSVIGWRRPLTPPTVS